MTHEDVLQERLEWLERGEPLQTCLEGLAEEDADLLRVAATFGQLAYPSRTAGRVAAQRQSLLRAARERSSTKAVQAAQVSAHSRWNWTIPVALAGAAVLLFFLCVAALVLGRISSGLSTAQKPTPGPGGSPPLAAAPVPSIVASAPNAQSAVIAEARGIVEMQSADGAWTAVKTGQVLQVGQRLRTRELSNATLLFYDQSQARLGPATEVSLDKLDAQTSGPRIVRMTQWSGETDHDVTPSSNADSRYNVDTPSGSGAAQGTVFHVSVSPGKITRISVDEGAVAVTNVNVTVIVIAGQVTTVRIGAPPDLPFFRVTGEGIVTQMGSTWRIGGLDFRADASTLVVGNPQIGDLVTVEGHLLADGTRVADYVALLRRAPGNRFSFTGIVSAIRDDEWTISGRAVRVNRDTAILGSIKTGDDVEADGTIQPDGTLLAEHIRLVSPPAGLPFEFTGLVQSIVSRTWTISGVAIAVDANTHVDAGIVVGNIVQVQGRILQNGTWLATSIQRAQQPEHRFEFSGVVQSLAPWIVSGIGFQTDDQTEIESGIKVGDRVRVEGRVLENGTWLAEEIQRIDETTLRFELVGRVTRVNPWIVGGVPISVTGQTQVDSGIAVGDLVRVQGRILPNGIWMAETIRRVGSQPACSDTFGVVIQSDGGQITLQNGQIIRYGSETQIKISIKGKDTKVKDDRKVDMGSTVLIRICTRADGTIIVVSIIIIQFPEAIPPSGVPPRTGLCINPAGKIMPCPPGNPPSFRRLDEGDGGTKDKRHDGDN